MVAAPPVIEQGVPRLALAGDTMLGRGVGERLRHEPVTARVAPEVLELVRDADLFVLNLEGGISDTGEPWPASHRHWFRAKFGGNRFRLFFRADSRARVIVYAWVNDRDTLRKAGAGSDPYAVFAGMLAGGNPPDDWLALLAAAQAPEAARRFGAAEEATEGQE